MYVMRLYEFSRWHQVDLRGTTAYCVGLQAYGPLTGALYGVADRATSLVWISRDLRSSPNVQDPHSMGYLTRGIEN